MRIYTLDQLALFTAVCMDHARMRGGMQSLGFSQDVCYTLPSSDSTRRRDVVCLY